MDPLEAASSICRPIGSIGSRFMFDPATYAGAADHGYSGLDFYFAGRCGVLGDVDADIVNAALGFFEPANVRALWEQGIAVAGAQRASELFAASCAEWGRQHFGDQAGGEDVDYEELAELAGRVIDAAPGSALPIFVGWRNLPVPDDAKGAAAHRLNTLRELRGGVHLIAVVAAGIDPAHAVLSTGGPANEPFPVMIYEAPLLDRDGGHAGWMSAVLDVSAERRMEELSRQQQERLQATARLATVGEMASLLSHELNQPLAAIASYATGSLNLMADPEPPADTLGLLRQATERIAEQAERAGRIIKSVHGFVRRREQSREALAADLLIDAVLPLIRLQARKSGARIEVDCPKPAPRVLADRTMVEQVLLNLARNGIQAMETATPLAQRVLTLRVRQHHTRWVEMAVVDAGPGIPPEVAKSVFTPFFTTREEGMGLGLSLCRTVIEQHGGALDFGPATQAGQLQAGGTEFRFTLPVPDNTRRATAAAPNPTPPP